VGVFIFYRRGQDYFQYPSNLYPSSSSNAEVCLAVNLFFGYLNLVVAFIAHVAYVAGVHRGGRGETRSFALLVCSSPSL